MKKFYSTLLWLLAAVPMMAQTQASDTKVKEGTVTLFNGAQELKTFSAKHLKITFSEKEVHFTQDGATTSFVLADYSNLQLGLKPTAIAALPTATSWKVSGQEVLVNLPVGTTASLYSLNGQLVATHLQTSSQYESLGRVNIPGLYLLRVKNVTLKIFVR